MPLMEAGSGLTEVMKLSECDFIKYCMTLYLKTFLSKVNQESPNEIWYLGDMIVKHRRQCEVYSGKALKQCIV